MKIKSITLSTQSEARLDRVNDFIKVVQCSVEHNSETFIRFTVEQRKYVNVLKMVLHYRFFLSHRCTAALGLGCFLLTTKKYAIQSSLKW